jgi:hypothetical protein
MQSIRVAGDVTYYFQSLRWISQIVQTYVVRLGKRRFSKQNKKGQGRGSHMHGPRSSCALGSSGKRFALIDAASLQ